MGDRTGVVRKHSTGGVEAPYGANVQAAGPTVLRWRVSCHAWRQKKIDEKLGFGARQRVHTIVINASRRPP
jgi:hypothetical protein